MPIISIKDNENSRWKRKAKTKQQKKQKNNSKKSNKDRKEQGGTEAMVKGWELNDFILHLSWSFSDYYLKLL